MFCGPSKSMNMDVPSCLQDALHTYDVNAQVDAIGVSCRHTLVAR